MEKKKLVVLTGAGISAESGLKTFRDSDGLWEGYDVYEVASPRGWARNPALVLDFYNMRRKNVREAEPNAAHIGLAALEKDFNVHIITQNIDDLHERGGSSRVLHLHGEILKMRSLNDPRKNYPVYDDIKPGDLAPDGYQLRPDIVWFDEPVPLIETAAAITSSADIFVVIGTSLAVYPAAGLLHYAPVQAPKFILDKNLPAIPSVANLTKIEMGAAEGISVLSNYLSALV
ncbi:SIR2 family NAD-dependent protein deacylase [Sediminibacterium soli]|uniref:SIR2 family NAD-dependent protein deacylase n=1 Tax=Sediminibacterium soli TaxID=2698829 RepID=UPI0013797376|nr:Sir2 family NAD-dependent protein deacetylase [Sediminibacterium soli]NCI46198.1 NAD-dependent deacylase [Sediminibacterium soli]